MREKRPTREGRRTGLRIHNVVKRLEDGTEDFNEYFENTDEEEDDDTSNLETESEMQDTLHSYNNNINFTGVSVDSTDSNEYPLIHQRSQGNSSKYVKDLGKKSLGRKSYGAKKKSFSKKRRSVAFQYSDSDSDSDSSYQEKTYVDKSVVTTPVSVTFSSRVTPCIGFSHSVAASPNLKSKAVKASSSKSIMVEPQRNILSTTIGNRDRESGILKSGNSFNLSARSNKERKSSLRNTYKKSGDQATSKRLSSGLEIQKSAELDDGIGMAETFSSKALRSSNSDCSRLQPKKFVSFSQNLNEDDGIEMPPVSDVNSESESKKELSLCRSPRLKRSLPASNSRTDVINHIEAQAASVKRKLNFSTLNNELNTTRGQEVTSPEMISLSKRFSPQQSCVDMDETEIIGRRPNVNLSRRRLSASMTVPVDRVGEEFDKERDSNAFKTPSVDVNINPLPSTYQSSRKHCSPHWRSSLQNRSSLQHAHNSHSAPISHEELDKTQIDKSTISVNSKSPRPQKNTSDSRHNLRQADKKSLQSPKLSDSRNHQEGKYLERETRIERDHNKSNSSMRRDPIEPRHSASFRHGEPWDSGVPELPADNAFEILKAQTQPQRSIRYQSNYLLKSSERACKQSDSESAIPESQSDCDGEIDHLANRKPLRESQNLKDSRILKFASNARDEPSNIDNFRSNLSLRKETKKSCGQFRQSASFRHEEPEEAGVSEKITNNACNYELPSQKRQVRSSGSRYQYHHVQKSPQRVQESDFESDILELPVERGNLAAQKHFTESRNCEERHLNLSEKEDRAERDHVRSTLSMREPNEFFDQCSPSHRYRNSSFRVEEQGDSGVPKMQMNKESDFRRSQGQRQQVRSSELRYQSNDPERVHEESDSENYMPQSQLHSAVERDSLAVKKSLSVCRNLEDSRNRKSISSTRETQTNRDDLRSSMRKEPKDSCSNSHQYRHSTSIRLEEPNNAAVHEIPTNMTSNFKIQKNQTEQKRSSESRYRSDHRQQSVERGDSGIDALESHLITAKSVHLPGLMLTESRSDEGDRHRKSISSESKAQTDGNNDRGCNSPHNKSYTSFRQEEQRGSSVPKALINKASNYVRSKDQKLLERSSKSSYQFDHRQTSQRYPEGSDSEREMSESQLDKAQERVNLSRQGQKQLERSSKSNYQFDHRQTSERFPEGFDSEIELSESQLDKAQEKVNLSRQGQKQLERSSKSNYQFDHRQTSERFPEGFDSEIEMSESQLDNAQEKVNLSGQKYPSKSRRQHGSFSSARNEENPNDRREAVSRKIPCPNLSTSKSKRELNRSRSGIPQTTVVNECDISLLSRSKSGRAINSPGQKDSRHSECERVVSPLKTGEKQGSDLSTCNLRNRKTNTSLELNRSKSGRTPILLQTSSRRSTRSHKPQSPSKLVSENLLQNDIVEDDRNPEVSEESRSQVLGSVKRKRNSSPRKGQEELEDQEIVNDKDENNISPRRQIGTSPQKTNSRVYRGTSRTKESNHLPNTKKRVERKNKLKSRDKAPSPTPYLLGRPQRSRIRPLAYWKGEYRTFRYTKDGDIVLAEVNLVNSPSINIPKKVHKPVVKKQKIEDDIIPEQEQLYLYDEATRKNRKLVGVHPELDWSSGPLGSDPGFRVARSDWTKNFTSGFLELNINGTKEEQHSPKLSLKFIVMEGIVRFTLRDRDGGEMAVNVGRRNFMIVPRRIPYSLTNCYAGKSLLYFHSFMDF